MVCMFGPKLSAPRSHQRFTNLLNSSIQSPARFRAKLLKTRCGFQRRSIVRFLPCSRARQKLSPKYTFPNRHGIQASSASQAVLEIAYGPQQHRVKGIGRIKKNETWAAAVGISWRNGGFLNVRSNAEKGCGLQSARLTAMFMG